MAETKEHVPSFEEWGDKPYCPQCREKLGWEFKVRRQFVTCAICGVGRLCYVDEYISAAYPRFGPSASRRHSKPWAIEQKEKQAEKPEPPKLRKRERFVHKGEVAD